MAGVQGFEPRKCQSQSLMPYRLATPQYFQQTILYHIKLSLSIPILNFFEKIIHYFLFFRKIAFFYFTNALFCDTIQRSDQNLPVAQLDSASDSDSEGQRFESVRVGQNKARGASPSCFVLDYSHGQEKRYATRSVCKSSESVRVGQKREERRSSLFNFHFILYIPNNDYRNIKRDCNDRRD